MGVGIGMKPRGEGIGEMRVVERREVGDCFYLWERAYGKGGGDLSVELSIIDFYRFIRFNLKEKKYIVLLPAFLPSYLLPFPSIKIDQSDKTRY